MDTKNSQYGTIWINNSNVNKKIKKDDLIPEGWVKGRINVHNEESKKQISQKCSIASKSSAKKRKETILERYGSFITESRKVSLDKYWTNERNKKDTVSFDKKSKAYKRKHILNEQNEACLSCNLTHWMGKTIKFELDHIDGNTANNARENLRMLCPNCHSFTDTWRKKKADVA